TDEDAERVRSSGLIAPERVVGVETGACPHTAIREDPTANLAAVRHLESAYAPLDVILIESGGDNLAATFTSELADWWMYVIDTAAGDDIPRKGGLGLLQADLLIINKTDLASHVGADLDRMYADAITARGSKPTVLTDLRPPDGASGVYGHLRHAA